MVMEELRTNLSANERLAMQLTGMEGTGEHFIINGESADKALQREKAMKFNTVVDELTDKFERHNEIIEQYAKDLSEDMDGLEIMPMGPYALIKPFDQNPFQKIKITKSGIITDLGGMQLSHKSQETGEEEDDEIGIKVGTVIEVGPKCEFLRPGDVVFYTVMSECIVPFYKLGFVTVAENRIIAVVNEKLTERKNNYGNI